MLGCIVYHENSSSKPYLRQEQLLGGTFLVLDLGRGAQGPFAARRAARAAKRMLTQGVHRAVFPVNFPHTAVFLRQGIAPVDPLPLRRALSARYVHHKLAALGLSVTQAVIAISGEYVSDELAHTVVTLARSYRYVMLSVPSGGEEYARMLRQQYGISLLLNPSPDQLDRADALLLFSPRSDLTRENPVLCTLYPGEERGSIPLQLATSLTEIIPENCCRDQLAAALHSMGILSPRQLLGEEIPVETNSPRIHAIC